VGSGCSFQRTKRTPSAHARFGGDGYPQSIIHIPYERQPRNAGRCERDPALLAICVAASADAHQANISTARVEALPQRFVAVELALKGSDVDQRCGTHASPGAPWRDEQGARCRKPGLASAGDTARVSRDTANLEVQQNNVRVLQRTLKDTRNRFEAS
jgi:hypothetical protein